MRRVGLLLVMVLWAGGCAHEVMESPLSAGAGCRRVDGGRELLACLSPSVALIETPYATGSAVLIDGGYLVTNAHVVDPFDFVTVRFQDGGSFSVDVQGVDLVADIAVLGPVTVDRPALTLETGADLERGDEVWLLGYPGEMDERPQVAVSDGVLSRVRHADHFEQTYLQTDAAIGGGQSGGALVDAHGRLVGISGLSFAEEFALALDGADVADAVQGILDGHGSEYATLPYAGATEHASVTLADPTDAQSLLVDPLYGTETLRLELSNPAGIGIEMLTLDGEPLFVNDVALAQYERLGLPVGTLNGLSSPPVSPGVWEVELPPGIEILISFVTDQETGAATDVVSSIRTHVLPPTERQALELDVEVADSIDFFELRDVYEVQLQEGDRVRVVVRSPQGDMAAQVLGPGESAVDAPTFDDGGGGLFDTDVDELYEAEHTGLHRIAVTRYDMVATAYTIELTSG